MTDLMIILILLSILGGAGFYVYKAKKAGQKCIGCPHSKSCASGSGCTGNCSGCSGNCGHAGHAE